MPKTTKREATRRAAKIAKAHATSLPKLDVREERQPLPGNKRPVRGIARYPWAIILSLLVIATSVYGLYFYKVGPFAPQPVAKKPSVVSPCLRGNVVSQLTDVSPAPGPTTFSNTSHSYANLKSTNGPAMMIDTSKVYCVGLNTSKGLIVLELDPSLAPNTVNNFVFLAEQGFYDGMVFHRVVPNEIIQTGDPLGNDPNKRGTGGPGYSFKDETVKGDYTQGCVAMANSGANTNGSQFFICTADDSTKFTKSYNLFGHVVQGMDVALKIQGPGDDAASKSIVPDTMNHVLVVAVKP